jgi:xanthine/CO dehydrogenase XdhC/CoxF family maturation factor
MNRRETERLLGAIRDVRARGARAALATVVRVRGSAYRREGARILVRDDGSYECVLSGGCLEPAVADAAARVIETGTPSLVNYDLADDSVWSLGIGCSGEVDIYIERLDGTPLESSWLGSLERGEAAVLVTPLSGASGRLLVRPDHTVGTLGSSALDEDAADRARARLRSPFQHSGAEAVAHIELFFDVTRPPPHLAIFGAGPDAVPLAGQAWDLGFDVTVIDARDAFLTADRFPHASRVLAHFSQYARAVDLTSRSFVVIMNHHLERDREALRFALGSETACIGVLGPRSRFEKLVRALREQGVTPDAAALARVRSPVGLALGAETPEEIAVSILGEVVALQRGFEGGFLTGREASLHRPDDRSALARS